METHPLMDIVLTDAQQLLKQSAHAFLQEHCSKALVREMETDAQGYPPQLWQRMIDLGWLAWPFPSRYGGAEGDFFDLALLMEEIGYAAAPTPFFSSSILAGRLICEAGTVAQKRSFIPGIAAGTTLLTLAYIEADGDPTSPSHATTAIQNAEGFQITGTKCWVPNAHLADYILCIARSRPGRSASRGLSLFVISPQQDNIELRPLTTLVGDKLFEVRFNDTQVPSDALIGRLHGASRPLHRTRLQATALKCAEMVGGAQAVLDMTLDYVKQRVQFGRAIGAFQAVQHHCADMSRDLEMSRLLAYQACWKESQGQDAETSVSSAKLKLSRVYPEITRLAHQVTGGVGFYTEYPLELYTRRALADASDFGGPEYHAARLAQLVWGPAAANASPASHPTG